MGNSLGDAPAGTLLAVSVKPPHQALPGVLRLGEESRLV
jgi:hypothetical protein